MKRRWEQDLRRWGLHRAGNNFARARGATARAVLIVGAVAALAVQSPGAAAQMTESPKVAVELAARGQVTLLREELATGQWSEGQRKLLQDVAALVLDASGNVGRTDSTGTSTGKSAPALTVAERGKLLAGVASAAEVSAAEKIDPAVAEQLAAVIIARLVEPRLAVLEYWEQDGTVRRRVAAEVAPVASAAVLLLQSSADQLRTAADGLSQKITTIDSPAAAEYERVMLRQRGASYTRWMAEYARLLAMETSDPRRAEGAKQAIAALEEFAVDGSGVEMIVRTRIAKYQLLAGDATAAAKAVQAALVATGGGPGLQYDARYVGVVAAIKSGEYVAARGKLAELRTFGRQAFGDGSAAVVAAERMLEYRLEAAAGQPEAARAALMKLVADRPDLIELVQTPLLAGMADGDLRSVDAEVLLLLARSARQQSSGDGQARQEIVGKGIAAADEIIRRADPLLAAQSRPQPSAVREAMLARGILLAESSGSDPGRGVLAASALLDFVTAHPADEDASAALNTAGSVVARLRQLAPGDAKVDLVYGRLLAVAVGQPFDRGELRYEYGRWLMGQAAAAGSATQAGNAAKFRMAMEQLARVPRSDANHSAAVLSRILCVKQLLDSGIVSSAAERLTLATSAGELAAQLEKDRAGQRVAGWLLAADVVGRHGGREAAGDPAGALAMLAHVDTSGAAGAEGLSRGLVGQVLSLRVSLLMETGQNEAAGKAVLELLAQDSSQAQADVLVMLLQRLEADMSRALASDDLINARRMARQRSELAAGLAAGLVASGGGEEMQRYRLALFHAEATRAEVPLAESAQARQAKGQAALGLYDTLAAERSQAVWRQASGRQGLDPLVEMGQAVLKLELGRETEASRAVLSRLLEGRLLGSAMVEGDDGALRPNSRWWDATLALYEANAKLVIDAGDRAAKQDLLSAVQRLYVLYGEQPGGAVYGARVGRLRAMLGS